MKGLIIALFLALSLAVVPAAVFAGTGGTAGAPPVSQPMVREGALAVKLAAALDLGTTANEAEAESLLAGAGIAPRNGWIADYPVTPDIVGELKAAVAGASDAGKVQGGREAALKTFDDVLTENNLAISPDGSGQAAESEAGEAQPDAAVINNYYYDEGPPVVTYYAPPTDYAYLYSWVPYPFWWYSSWFPGFYVMVDFDVFIGHGHHRHHFSNHVFDPRGDRFYSVDPARRAFGGRFFTNDRPRTYRNITPASGRAVNGAVSRGSTSTPFAQSGRDGVRAQTTRPFISSPARNTSPAWTGRSYRSPVSQPAVRQPAVSMQERRASVAPPAFSRPMATPRMQTAVPGVRSFGGGEARSFAPAMGGGMGRSFSAGSMGGGGRSFGGGRGWR